VMCIQRPVSHKTKEKYALPRNFIANFIEKSAIEFATKFAEKVPAPGLHQASKPD
jgi:hypothetical protein